MLVAQTCEARPKKMILNQMLIYLWKTSIEILMEEIKRVVRDKRDSKNRDEIKLLAFLESSDK